jgi:hypothetical protein
VLKPFRPLIESGKQEKNVSQFTIRVNDEAAVENQLQRAKVDNRDDALIAHPFKKLTKLAIINDRFGKTALQTKSRICQLLSTGDRHH